MASKPKSTVSITKLFTNQIILGDTTSSGNNIFVSNPYIIIQDYNGIKTYPYDEDVLGKKLDMITVDQKNVLYSTEAPEAIVNIYEKDKAGIIDEPEAKPETDDTDIGTSAFKEPTPEGL